MPQRPPRLSNESTHRVLVTGADGQLAALHRPRVRRRRRSRRSTGAQLDITDPAAVRARRGRRGAGRHRQLRRVQRRGRRRRPAARGAGRQRLRGAQPGAARRRTPARRSCTTAPTSSSTARASEPYDGERRSRRRTAPMRRRSCWASGSRSTRRARCVLRVESLFGSPPDGPAGAARVDAIVDGIRAGREVRGASPIASCRPATRPTSPRPRGTWSTGGAAPGLYHCVNAGHATWEQWRARSRALLGVEPMLKRLTTDQVTLRAARPRYCALSPRSSRAAGFAMPAWQDALRRWLRPGDRIDGHRMTDSHG